MTKQEYHEMLRSITTEKTRIEQDDAELKSKIDGYLCQLKGGATVEVQAEMDRCKTRRFDGLEQERRELCEGYIKEKTGFTGNILQIYTNAEDQGLKGEMWAKFILKECGCPEPR